MTTKIYDLMIIDMPAGLEREILRVLSFHVGKKHALGRDQLVEEVRARGYDAHERQVRQCIHDLRRKGILICSMPGEEGGYYMAASLEEVLEFLERELHPKATDMLETESTMKASARQQFGEAVQLGML
jgi:repressor of nif and glnA expression